MKPFLLTWLAGAGGINLGFHLQGFHLTLRFRAVEGRAFGDQVGKSGCRPGQRMGIPGRRVLPLAWGKWGVRLAEIGLPQHFPPSSPGGGGWGGQPLARLPQKEVLR